MGEQALRTGDEGSLMGDFKQLLTAKTGDALMVKTMPQTIKQVRLISSRTACFKQVFRILSDPGLSRRWA
jgi:hypothetical protein